MHLQKVCQDMTGKALDVCKTKFGLRCGTLPTELFNNGYAQGAGLGSNRSPNPSPHGFFSVLLADAGVQEP